MKNYCEFEYIWKKYTKIVKVLRMSFFKGSNYGFAIVPGGFKMICNNIYYFFSFFHILLLSSEKEIHLTRDAYK